jgi:uncharacterized glyoxalase superfamily protein PhnB
LFAALGCGEHEDKVTLNEAAQKSEERKAMKLGYTLFYVSDVETTLEFFETAFGLERKFLSVEGDKGYGELNTGGTTLGFVSYAQARSVGIDFVEPEPDGPAHAVEIGFVTDDVSAAYEKAVQHGATPVAPPAEKPWGQTVSYVRDKNGILVEICSEMTMP